MNPLHFLVVCWSINISLNILGIIKNKYPRVRHLDRAVDGGVTFFDGTRILGSSTTWLGLVLVLILGVSIYWATQNIQYVVIALLVYLGHALGSFVKRRLGFEDGEYLPVIDHGDYILLVGGYCVSVDLITLFDFILVFVITITLTPLVTLLFHKVGWREKRL